MVIGITIVVGIQFLATWGVRETNDAATKFFFGHAAPYFLNSFFIFGFFPIICKYMNLVQKQEQFESQYPDLAKSFVGARKTSFAGADTENNQASALMGETRNAYLVNTGDSTGKGNSFVGTSQA